MLLPLPTDMCTTQNCTVPAPLSLDTLRGDPRPDNEILSTDRYVGVSPAQEAARHGPVRLPRWLHPWALLGPRKAPSGPGHASGVSASAPSELPARRAGCPGPVQNDP